MLHNSFFKTLSYFVVALVATSAFAEPPVPSWRDNEGSTYQVWSFSSDSTTPDVWDNDYGHYNTSGIGLSVDEQGWFPSISDANGVYALQHQIDIVIPNNPVPNDQKDVLLHIVWKELGNDPTGAPFVRNPYLADAPNIGLLALPYDQDFDVFTSYSLGAPDSNGWHHSTYEITIWPNPSMEYISIKGNILVDYVAIDTRCVPEPATIVIITAGGLLALRSRKRSN